MAMLLLAALLGGCGGADAQKDASEAAQVEAVGAAMGMLTLNRTMLGPAAERGEALPESYERAQSELDRTAAGLESMVGRNGAHPAVAKAVDALRAEAGAWGRLAKAARTGRAEDVADAGAAFEAVELLWPELIRLIEDSARAAGVEPAETRPTLRPVSLAAAPRDFTVIPIPPSRPVTPSEARPPHTQSADPPSSPSSDVPRTPGGPLPSRPTVSPATGPKAPATPAPATTPTVAPPGG